MTNPALALLLDHIAVELAEEYVALMEKAASEGPAHAPPSEPKEAYDA